MASQDWAAPIQPSDGSGSKDKRQDKHFSQSAHLDKHTRVARSALTQIVLFNETLQDEMRQMIEAEKAGAALDKELFDRMVLVQDKYAQVMGGFREMDDMSLRHLLISFGDAMQDLMKMIHKRREN